MVRAEYGPLGKTHYGGGVNPPALEWHWTRNSPLNFLSHLKLGFNHPRLTSGVK